MMRARRTRAHARTIHWNSRKEHTAMPATDEELKKALKAFKKRLKVTRLDDESRLGHSPLSGNRGRIVSIQPPGGFGREIWEELADKGFLKRDSGGFYELVEGK
jgi:hypothetical protein